MGKKMRREEESMRKLNENSHLKFKKRTTWRLVGNGGLNERGGGKRRRQNIGRTSPPIPSGKKKSQKGIRGTQGITKSKERNKSSPIIKKIKIPCSYQPGQESARKNKNSGSKWGKGNAESRAPPPKRNKFPTAYERGGGGNPSARKGWWPPRRRSEKFYQGECL